MVPEYLIAAGIASLLSLFGVTFRKIDCADRRMDALELKVAENYVTKQEFKEQFQELFRVLERLEDKIDAHVGGDRRRIDEMKRKYGI